MEQEGWDYSSAKCGGKNLFLFRDNFHNGEENAIKIADAVSQKISEGFFNHLFCELPSGKFYFFETGSSSETERKSYLLNNYGAFTSMDILNYRFEKKKNKPFFFGVENNRLRKKLLRLMRYRFSLERLSKNISFVFSNHMISRLEKRINRIDKKRGIECGKNVLKKMEELKLETSGFLFGNWHYAHIKEFFIKKDVGFISYFPGKANYTKEQVDFWNKFVIKNG